MSLKTWCKNGWLRPWTPSVEQICELLAAADRDIENSQLSDLAPERKFSIAYNAILQTASAALFAEGYRASRDSHHYRVLESLSKTIGISSTTVDVLDKYRKKRHVSVYERVGAVSDQDVRNIIEMAIDVRKQVGDWLLKKHPELLK